MFKQVKQTVGVVDAIFGRPIRPVDLLLDARAVEFAVGKAIDRKNVAMIFVQPAAKFGHRAGVAQFAGGEVAQAQSDGVWAAIADAVADCQRVLLQGRKCFRPRFTAMDVRAIGQMQVMIQSHWVLKENLPDCSRNFIGFL